MAKERQTGPGPQKFAPGGDSAAQTDALMRQGFDLIRQGNFAAAKQVYDQVLAINPDDAGALHMLGQTTLHAGKPDAAIGFISRAIEVHPEIGVFYLSLGRAQMMAGDVAGAEKALRRAMELSKDGYSAHDMLARLLAREGRRAEGQAILDAALADAPQDSGLLRVSADFLLDDEHYEEAIAVYEKLLLLGNAPANLWSVLTQVYERLNRIEKAQEIIYDGLRFFPKHPALNRIAARLERRQGKFDEAVARLEALTISPQDIFNQAETALELGFLEDRRGNADKAFQCFTKANNIVAGTIDGDKVNPDLYRDQVRTLTDYFSSDPFVDWPVLECDSDSGQKTDPVFLVAFPRSGTTLLDQILDSHPGVVVLEERPLVKDMMDQFETLGYRYPQDLATLSAAHANELRAIYFAKRTECLENIEGAENAKLVIDKMPLNLIHGGFIHRLFPNARLVFAVRHPCDVCLSCFMQLFQLNNAMANFVSFERTIDLYKDVMGLWLRYEELFDLNLFRFRYEGLVDDFRGQVEAVVDFLGLPWDDAVLQYREHALSRKRIKTPSYHQVVQPIYTRAQYRWKRYRSHFEPYLPKLQRFIDGFDY